MSFAAHCYLSLTLCRLSQLSAENGNRWPTQRNVARKGKYHPGIILESLIPLTLPLTHTGFSSNIDAIMHPDIDHFSVMTLNLRFGLANDGPNAWEHRKKLMPGLFRAYPVDFIGCQEVNDFQADDLAAILRDYRLIGRRQPAPSFWQNNIIFFRKDWQVQNSEHFYLSEMPDIPSRSHNSQWPRQCTIGTFQRMSHKLTCINTHFDFSSAAQTFSAGLIMQRLLQRPDPVPAVLMGDFNAPFDSPHYRLFVNESAAGKKPGISFHNAFDDPPCGTHHGFSGKPGRDCIDWVLHTNGLTPENALVVRDDVAGSYYSDHFPVVVKFCFS